MSERPKIQHPAISYRHHGENEILDISHNEGSASLSLFGGHIISFVPKKDNRERLWVSNKAVFDNSTPIRGGIPICWPWFSNDHQQGNVDLPSHGFVRTQRWHVDAVDSNEHCVSVTLVPSTTLGEGWAHDTELKLVVSVGQQLSVALETTNNANNDIRLGCALHSYFVTNDIVETTIKGITGVYKDKLADWAHIETPVPYKITDETDRIHLQPTATVSIEAASITTVKSQGHDSIVVWNPWQANSMKMKDMEKDGYQTMVCVETALTQNFILASGKTHRLVQVVE